MVVNVVSETVCTDTGDGVSRSDADSVFSESESESEFESVSLVEPSDSEEDLLHRGGISRILTRMPSGKN